MNKRDILIFLAGACAWHAIDHVSYYFVGVLPMRTHWFTWTNKMNTVAIVGLIGLTVLLLYLGTNATAEWNPENKKKSRRW